MGQTSGALKIDIGIFAHNEGAGIAAMLADLAGQSLLQAGADLRLFVLANGCSDDTVAQARAALAASALTDRAEVLELPEPGKSRTWNRFTHEFSRAEADLLIYCDADIRFADASTLQQLADFMQANPQLAASSSFPVKDLALAERRLSLVEKLIVSGGSSREEVRSHICGQCYAARAAEVRAVHMPAGLPVEDGFLRAMLLTRNFTAPEDLSRIDASPAVWHIYESERTLAALIRHQTRIVIGGAVNLALFDHLRRLPRNQRSAALQQAAAQEGWLQNMLAAALPRAPWGWVPVHFLVKRSAAMLRAPGTLRPGRLAKLIAGQGFDLVVWLLAQWRMARGSGAGFW
ncbi:glycosyltransferase family 2 protein [Leisingera sp. XS_AS12]|uniref:glycosyltransferase n=1 Tax=Leisingera sp. XS_AS12 TaxID=3241294 RepID=UPI003518C696